MLAAPVAGIQARSRVKTNHWGKKASRIGKRRAGLNDAFRARAHARAATQTQCLERRFTGGSGGTQRAFRIFRPRHGSSQGRGGRACAHTKKRAPRQPHGIAHRRLGPRKAAKQAAYIRDKILGAAERAKPPAPKPREQQAQNKKRQEFNGVYEPIDVSRRRHASRCACKYRNGIKEQEERNRENRAAKGK